MESLLILFFLGIFGAILILPSLVFYLIERSARVRLGRRLEETERRMNGLVKSMTALRRTIFEGREMEEPAPSPA